MLKKLQSTPIRRNIIANFFGIGVTLFSQIVLVPFYITSWGNELYSDWIVLSALTAFFALSDVGLNTVIQNRFSIKLAENDTSECNALLADNVLIVSIIFMLVLLLGVSYISIFDIKEQMNLHILTRSEANVVLLLLLCNVFIRMYSSITNAIYRATRNASKAVYMDQVTLLIIALLTLVCLKLKTQIWIMCLMICIPNIILLIIKRYNSKKFYSYTISIKDIDIPLLRKVFIPSVSFLSFPLGNAIVLQGYSLLVNNYFGADSVVVFNTTRTMCNTIKTMLATVQSSVWPEYSIAYGKQDFVHMRHLHRKTIVITLIGVTFACAFMLIFGKYIYEIWTQGKVIFDNPLMVSFCVILFIESIWSSSSVALMATNKHSNLGLMYVITAGLSITVATIIGNSSTLPVIVLTMLIIQIPLCIYTVRSWFRNTVVKFT